MDKIIKLKRELSWIDCSGIILGIIIGTGIFSVFPSLIADHNMSTGLIMLAWVFGGVFSWFGALCYAELASIFPSAGGDYIYLHKVYTYRGESVVSFLFAWTKVFVIRPSSIAVLALIFGNELQKVFIPGVPPNFNTTLILSVLVVCLLTLINILGISLGKNIQNFITSIKIAAVVFIIVFGFYKCSFSALNYAPSLIPEGKNLWGMVAGFWSAMVLSMWVYGGWNEAVYVAEETKNPLKNIPKALFFGIFSITLLYLGITLIYLSSFTPKGLSETFNPASDLMTIWFGAKGGVIMASIIVISAAGAINGLIMTGGRISYAIAKNYPSLHEFTPIHPVYRTPQKALIANLAITIVLLLLSRGSLDFVESLTFYTAGVYWYFFGLVVVSLMLLRRVVPKEKIPFKVAYYPFSPVLFLIITISLIWGSIEFKPFETLAGISILTLGIPIYYIIHYKKEIHINNHNL